MQAVGLAVVWRGGSAWDTENSVRARTSPFVMPLFMLIAVRLVGCERKPARKPRLCAASMAMMYVV